MMRLGLLALLAAAAALALEALIIVALQRSLPLWSMAALPLLTGAAVFAGAGRRQALLKQRARRRRRLAGARASLQPLSDSDLGDEYGELWEACCWNGGADHPADLRAEGPVRAVAGGREVELVLVAADARRSPRDAPT
jgi:hypothetical protein